eukprot:TRINITY_DN13025_c0_g1_i1.p1 TRINITY_DN13025_c0_g1~~TRINITY_DN13025_c0_g1_i1.p1  ORF type:complete len:384 (+),score=33.40 TRINITY_DN13025_c0_g1_i1:555-1706(+)
MTPSSSTGAASRQEIQQPVIVVGGGVMGFVSALRLLESGRFQDVTLVAEKLSMIPSKTSPAVYRPAWMGKTPTERAIRWGKDSGQHFGQLARLGSEVTGITPTTHLEFYKTNAGPAAAKPDPVLSAVMPGFRDTTDLEMATFCPEAAGGWVYSTFMIEGMRYVRFLEDKARALGLQIVEGEKVSGPAQSAQWCEHACALAQKPHCSLLVNAMGVNGGPDCYPIRGDLILVKAPFVKVAVGEYNPQDPTRPTYIYPRRDHIVLGATYLEGDGGRDERSENTKDVIARCAEFVPELKDARVIAVVPCIRPGRKDGVRVDCVRVPRSVSGQSPVPQGAKQSFAVVNNYGHGGGGMSIAWGCAGEVVELMLRELAVDDGTSRWRARL